MEVWASPNQDIQTTNLGVRSSNLFGRANYFNYLRPARRSKTRNKTVFRTVKFASTLLHRLSGGAIAHLARQSRQAIGDPLRGLSRARWVSGSGKPMKRTSESPTSRLGYLGCWGQSSSSLWAKAPLSQPLKGQTSKQATTIT